MGKVWVTIQNARPIITKFPHILLDYSYTFHADLETDWVQNVAVGAKYMCYT